MKGAPIKPVHCAIYTRVSTDQGLDQEFNSLDAQYDASSAYRICAISISRGCAPDGRASSYGRRLLTCRDIYCLRSWPSGSRPIVSAISITRPERF